MGYSMEEELYEEFVDTMAEEEEIEREISSVLKDTGYDPETTGWKRAMFRWKRLRNSNPRLYRKFVSMD